jgi:hypothetical protein
MIQLSRIHEWRRSVQKPHLLVESNMSAAPTPSSILAPWCNWLTRRPLKAESSGSIPDGATKSIIYGRVKSKLPGNRLVAAIADGFYSSREFPLEIQDAVDENNATKPSGIVGCARTASRSAV